MTLFKRNGNEIYCILFCIFCLIRGSVSLGQNKIIPNFLDISELSITSEIDPNMPISNLSKSSYNDLVNQLYEIDQKYRDSLMKYKDKWKNKEIKDIDPRIVSYMKLMKVNDKANQKLLLRLLGKYGWPVDSVQFGSTKKAWFVAWHATIEEQKIFYKFLEKAVANHLFEESILIQFRKKMAHGGNY